MATDYRTVEFQCSVNQGCYPEGRSESNQYQNYLSMGPNNEKNLADEERANKKTRLMTEAAKEKHRMTNRLVAQRARARVKNEVESLRTDNAILLAQIDVMKSALVAVASLDYCTQVFEQCAVKKYELSYRQPLNNDVDPPRKRAKQSVFNASLISLSDHDDCCSSVGSKEPLKETYDGNSDDCTNLNNEMKNCYDSKFQANQSGFFGTHSSQYFNENNCNHMFRLEDKVDHGTTTHPPFKYVREDSFGSRFVSDPEPGQTYFFSGCPNYYNGSNNQELVNVDHDVENRFQKSLNSQQLQQSNYNFAPNSKMNYPSKTKFRSRQQATGTCLQLATYNTCNTRASSSPHQHQHPQKQPYHESTGHTSPLRQEPLAHHIIPQFTLQCPTDSNVTYGMSLTSPKLPSSLSLLSKSPNILLPSLSCSSNSVEVDSIPNDWVVDFFASNFLSGDSSGENIE